MKDINNESLEGYFHGDYVNHMLKILHLVLKNPIILLFLDGPYNHTYL